MILTIHSHDPFSRSILTIHDVAPLCYELCTFVLCRCAEAYAKDPSQGWDKIETDLLGGQKLQGTLTAKEVHEVLKRTGDSKEFPLFEAIYKIAFEGLPCSKITEYDTL
jgi:hypothetical protein